MITANNYFDKIKPIVSKLPADVKEAHELVIAMKNDGIDNPFNTGDKDIDEMGELLLQKANDILSSSEPKAEVKPKIEKPKKESAPSVKSASKPAAKKAAKKAPAKKATAKSPALKKAAQKTKRKEAKKTAKLIKQVVKNVRKADKAKPAVTKTIFSKELELIKQFISINGKTIKRQTLQTKHNAIANALKEGKVTMHIAHLKNILQRYNRVLSNLAPDTTEVRGNIEKGFLTTLKNVVAGAKIKVRTDVLGNVNDKITCSNCGWSWDKNQTTKSEMYKCHHCGHDNSLKK
jgi:chemotaxis protein histidine kinase CheA